MMTLDEYLKAAGMSNAAFAREVESTEATISRIRRGLNKPALDLAEKIIEHTENKVTLKDLVGGEGRGARQG